MARYYGLIGFATQQETRPGVWEDVITELPYYGDILRNTRRWDPTTSVNSNFALTNTFSIIADAYLYSHIPDMRYLEYMGTNFAITSVEIERPRVILSVGSVYVAGGTPTNSSVETGGDSGE